MAGQKDGQNLFHEKILPATTRGITSTALVDWHLQVKDRESNVGLTKIIATQSACKKTQLNLETFLKYNKFESLTN